MDAVTAFHKSYRTLSALAVLCTHFQAFAEESVGQLSAVVGKAEIIRDGKTLKATKGMEIFSTDHLGTSPKTAVKIQFKDGSSFMAFENSSIKIEEYKIKAGGKGVSIKSAFDIAKGKVRFFVKPREEGNSNEVEYKTANAVMGIRGTSGVIDASVPGKTQLVVLTGKVQVSNPSTPGASVFVAANQMTDVVGKSAPLAPRVAPPALLKQAGAEPEVASQEGAKKESENSRGEQKKEDQKEEGKGESGKESAPSKSEGSSKEESKPSSETKSDAPKEEGKGKGESEVRKSDEPQDTGRKADGQQSEPKKSETSGAEGKKAEGASEPKKAEGTKGEENPRPSQASSKPADQAPSEGSGKGNESGPTASPKETGPKERTSGATAASAPPKSTSDSPAKAPVADVPAAENSPKMEKKIVFTPEGKSAVVVTGNANLQKVVAPSPVISTIRIQEAQPAAMKVIQAQTQQVSTVTTAIEQKVIQTIEPQRQAIVIATPTPVPTPAIKTIRVRVQLPSGP